MNESDAIPAAKLAETFEDLRIWQDARVLVRMTCAAMRNCRDDAFRDQMRRAAWSMMNNIADGFERHPAKDFAHFLDQAKGSCGQARSMSYAGEDQGCLKPAQAGEYRAFAVGLSKSIAALTRHLRRNQS